MPKRSFLNESLANLRKVRRGEASATQLYDVGVWSGREVPCFPLDPLNDFRLRTTQYLFRLTKKIILISNPLE